MKKNYKEIDLFSVNLVNPKQLKKLILKQTWGKNIFLLKDKLHDIGIDATLVPLPISNNIYFTDYIQPYIREFYGEQNFYFCIIFEMNSDGTEFQDDVFIWYDKLGNKKKSVISICKDIFGDAYIWNGNNKKRMKLDLVKV